MTPADLHAATLALLDERIQVASTLLGRGLVRNPAVDELAGRRRILERHAPREENSRVGYCGHCPVEGIFPAFPCADYRDAAAGLGVDLPEVSA